jgi:predicted HD superfamily hydrolase involved in NAD metabolism
MNNEYVAKIKDDVQAMLGTNEKRYWHTVGVANTCACLAMKYGVDVERAYIAGLLHDCAKCLSDDELIRECEKNGIAVSKYEQQSPYLLHGKVGAYYARTKFQIEDEEILSAISFHTTGKPDMTRLEEIVFIADYIEPFRNKAGDLDEIRGLVFDDITFAIYRVCNDTIEYLKRSGSVIDETTVQTFEYYKGIVESRN